MCQISSIYFRLYFKPENNETSIMHVSSCSWVKKTSLQCLGENNKSFTQVPVCFNFCKQYYPALMAIKWKSN